MYLMFCFINTSLNDSLADLSNWILLKEDTQVSTFNVESINNYSFLALAIIPTDNVINTPTILPVSIFKQVGTLRNSYFANPNVYNTLDLQYISDTSLQIKSIAGDINAFRLYGIK